MKTQIKKNGDTVVVSMDGRLDFETNGSLREELTKLIAPHRNTDSTPKKIIFNLENLEFVGSSGISSFVQTMKEFNASVPNRPRYCNVKSEFKRVIKAFDEEQPFEFHDNEERAKKASINNQNRNTGTSTRVSWSPAARVSIWCGALTDATSRSSLSVNFRSPPLCRSPGRSRSGLS